MFTTKSFSILSSTSSAVRHLRRRCSSIPTCHRYNFHPPLSSPFIHRSGNQLVNCNRVAPSFNLTTTRRFKCLAMGRDLESSGVPTSVPVKVAHELLQAGHRYLDVRTHEEFSSGHPSGAINIPYMYRAGSGMAKNPKFIEEVAMEFRKDDEIIVGCQLGKRSLMAAADLLSAGFVGVTDMSGGYAAWAQTGLPTET